MSIMKETSTSGFKPDVLDSGLPVVVVIWGSGWGFCRALKPQVEALADELSDRINFFKLEIVSNQQLLIDLNVSGLPSFLFFKNGQKASVLAGGYILLDEIKDHSEKLLV